MSLYPLPNMFHENVGLGGDGEGGGGIEGKEDTPQLVQTLLPVWLKLQAKNGSIDISELDKDIKVQALDGIWSHQGVELVQTIQNFPNFRALVVALEALIGVRLDTKQVFQYSLDLRPAAPLQVVEGIIGKEKTNVKWAGRDLVKHQCVPGIPNTFGQKGTCSHALKPACEFCPLNRTLVYPSGVVHLQRDVYISALEK